MIVPKNEFTHELIVCEVGGGQEIHRRQVHPIHMTYHQKWEAMVIAVICDDSDVPELVSWKPSMKSSECTLIFKDENDLVIRGVAVHQSTGSIVTANSQQLRLIRDGEVHKFQTGMFDHDIRGICISQQKGDVFVVTPFYIIRVQNVLEPKMPLIHKIIRQSSMISHATAICMDDIHQKLIVSCDSYYNYNPICCFDSNTQSLSFLSRSKDDDEDVYEHVCGERAEMIDSTHMVVIPSWFSNVGLLRINVESKVAHSFYPEDEHFKPIAVAIDTRHGSIYSADYSGRIFHFPSIQ